MKVAAHPLIVAAALGLLGPVALESDEGDEKQDGACAFCPEATPEAAPESVAYEPTVDAPTPDEFARVEAEWRQATLQMDADLKVS